ncbi:alkaline phosphatase family protein [Natronobacterium texcoconense]|uniref:Predicted phosphohydrolase or phosphomutase, AlkP superfamily n=1 Tax=Natronobacterium texcoconense TaxID=1095778 RepID=A0A1H1F786_NATTX|nr:alkaline phosphatase family protein [Natronobacterium texcoconense]SDQ96737.1 Predicted phosphohydrolase or phosphomutase, AlkP superfamily [Natronobacterium texcoconense]
MTRASDTDRAFVLGIDGVPWNLLRKWIDAGELPSFRRLRDEGVAAPLESTIPPTTPTAWPTIATGARPDNHGIYGFQKLQTDYTQEMNTSADRTCPALWNLFSPAVVGNVPMTYPASDIDGAMVSGMISPSTNERFAHPTELADEITEEIPDYRIGLNWYDYAGEEDRFQKDLNSLVAARRALMNRLMEIDDWRLFFFVFTAPDRLQHLIWEEDVILEHYKQLDDILADVFEYVDERDANLFVASDHGFGPISKFVHLNAVLEQEGFLSRKDRNAAGSSLAQLGVTKSNVLGTLKRVGIDEKRFIQSLPKGLVDGIAEQVPGDHGLYDVDFEDTIAFAHGPSYVYVNDIDRFEEGAVAPANVDAVKRELRSAFEDVTDPDTGDRALSVYDGDEVFPDDDASPDLIVVGKDGYEEKTKLGDDVFAPAGTKAASHRSEGVFFAHGPAIDGSSGEGEPDDLSVVDVAPTLLHSIGEPIPDEMDGEVRTELLEADVDPTVRRVEPQATAGSSEESSTDGDVDEDFDGVEERLKGLGYME